METQRTDYHNQRHHHHQDQHLHEQHANYHQINNQFYQDNHSTNYDFNHQMNSGEPNGPSFGDGGGFHSNGRRRGRFGSDDGAGSVKLYIAPVPRTITQENVWAVFSEHGNVVEVIIPRDKRSGQQHAYCFVKYATIDDADRAIRALNNLYTFAGETNPVKVRYADGERERHGKTEREQLGGSADRLYVGSINKQASKEDIEEIFSPYGCVEEVFIARDERGYAFVKLSHRDMAVAAIEALHGTFTMKGCDQPLIVRFAEPKRPRFGEPRGNSVFGRPNFGPGPQDPAVRPAPKFGDSMGGYVLANASYHVQEPNIQPQAVSYMMKQEPASAHITGQHIIPVTQPPQVTQMPLQHAQAQAPAESFQSSQQMVSEVQRQTQNLEQQQRVHSPFQETVSNIQVSSGTSAVPAAPSSPQTADQQDCDWSEHTCPDGHKYYYNCTTCESRWEKPEGFAIFQQESEKKQKLNHSNQQSDASSAVVSVEVVNPLQKEMDGEDVQQKTSSAVDSISTSV